jgi:SMI1 / KNR4 family (SUKH-1)
LSSIYQNLRFLTVNPPATDSEVKEAEVFIGFPLPVELRSLLLQHNGISLSYNSFKRAVDKDNEVEFSVDIFESTQGIIEAWSYLHDDEDFVEAKIIPIGGTLSAALVGMGYVAENFGKIIIFDWDFGSTWQADSLQEFLCQLHYDA